MFKWLRRRLGLTGPDESEYDAVYGFPKQAVAEWLQWNPQLALEHQARQQLAQTRRDNAAGTQGAR